MVARARGAMAAAAPRCPSNESCYTPKPRIKHPQLRNRRNFMPNYAFAYYGEPKFESPEEGAKYMTKWKAWMSALGDAFVNPGNPFGKPKTVSSGGVSEDGGSNRLTGYSIVK